ncbi:MAG: hypothetical protein AB3N23_03915 [Paracoccaceae bacterium]
MTDTIDISDHSAELVKLMRDKLRVRGRTLRTVLARGKYRLPKRIVRAVHQMIEAEDLAQNPKLRMMIDGDAVTAARREVETFLADIDPSDERKGRFLGILASLAVNLLSLVILLIAVLMWRGFL